MEDLNMYLRKTTNTFIIMDKEETLKYIQDSGCSIGRFGDGEICLMTFFHRNGVPPFQKGSFALRKDLIRVANSNNPNFLVCIPSTLNNLNCLNDRARLWWEGHFKTKRKYWNHYFNYSHFYGDTEITRPWIDTHNAKLAEICFSLLSREWEGKDVVLIEGEKSRVGVGNNLLTNAKSIKRILCPAINAYSVKDIILKKALEFPKSVLFLLALGPTATILSYELCLAGYRALDIGHIDVEYSWYKMNAREKEPIKNKFVNEAGGYETLIETEIEKSYFNEIIANINHEHI